MEDQTYFDNPEDTILICGKGGFTVSNCRSTSNSPKWGAHRSTEEEIIELIKDYKDIIFEAHNFDVKLLVGLKNINSIYDMPQENIQCLIDSGGLLSIRSYYSEYDNIDFRDVEVTTELGNILKLINKGNKIKNATIIIDLFSTPEILCKRLKRAIDHLGCISIIYEPHTRVPLEVFEVIKESGEDKKFLKFVMSSKTRGTHPLQIVNLNRFSHITVRHNCKPNDSLQLNHNTTLKEFVTLEEEKIVRGVYKEIEELVNNITNSEFRFKRTKAIFN